MIYAFYSVGSKEPIQRYPDLSHDAGAETSCCSEVTCGCQIQASTVADIVTICVALIVTICPIQLCWLVEWRICKSALLPSTSPFIVFHQPHPCIPSTSPLHSLLPTPPTFHSTSTSPVLRIRGTRNSWDLVCGYAPTLNDWKLDNTDWKV